MLSVVEPVGQLSVDHGARQRVEVAAQHGRSADTGDVDPVAAHDRDGLHQALAPVEAEVGIEQVERARGRVHPHPLQRRLLGYLVCL